MSNMKKLTVFFIGIISTFLSCTKEEVIYNNTPKLPSNAFYFQVLKNGQSLERSVLDSVKLFVVKNGYRMYQDPYVYMDDRSFIKNGNEYFNFQELNGANILYGRSVANYVDNYYSDWYLEFPNGDIDTIYVESPEVAYEVGSKDQCNCLTPITVLKFNGKDAYKHPTLKSTDGKAVYVLEK